MFVSKKKLLMTATLCGLMLASNASFAQAANHNPLNDAFVIGSESGLSVDSKGEFLWHWEEILPGDQFKDVLVLENKDDEGYDLYMKIQDPIQIAGPIHFGQSLELTILYDGVPFYTGQADGVGTPVLLDTERFIGHFNPGDSRTMEVTYTMDPSVTELDYGDNIRSITENTWFFRAIKKDKETPVPPGKEPPVHRPPNAYPQLNGLDASGLAILGGLFVTFGLLFVVKKRKNAKGGL